MTEEEMQRVRDIYYEVRYGNATLGSVYVDGAQIVITPHADTPILKSYVEEVKA